MNFAVIDANDSGAAAVMALLSNLPLNLTIELANATMDSAAYYNYDVDTSWLGHATYPAGTRINVEVINGSSKTYGSDYNLASNLVADPGDIVITIATTDATEQDSVGAGRLQYMIVVQIDVSAGMINVRLCQRAIVLQASAMLGIIAEIDLGAGVTILGGLSISISGIPLEIGIPLDIAETLGSLFDVRHSAQHDKRSERYVLRRNLDRLWRRQHFFRHGRNGRSLRHRRVRNGSG